MRIRKSIMPSPYVEADPDDVVVTGIERGPTGMEAWGYLRSEMRLVDIEVPLVKPLDRVAFKPGSRYEPGPMYRVAYTREDGGWQAEGTVTREPPHPAVLRQIIDLSVRDEFARQDAAARRRLA